MKLNILRKIEKTYSNVKYTKFMRIQKVNINQTGFNIN